MILSDKDIKKYLDERRIIIKPSPDLAKQLGPASLDIRLGNEFKIFNHSKKAYVDPMDSKTFEGLTDLVKIENGQYFVFQPGQFILAVTLEEVSIPDDIGARIEGRSSWGRLGVIIHSTAGYVDPGFSGRMTLEMKNIGMLPVFLRPGARICQLAFEKLSSPAVIPYSKKKGAKYFRDMLPTESRLYKDE